MRIGAEYDILTKGNTESTIISVSINYDIIDNMDAYIRYDIYDGADTVVNRTYSESYLIAGVLLDCSHGLAIAPNMRIATYDYDSLLRSNSEPTSSATEYKINFQFNF